jgi:hypothetical protein
MPRLHFACLEKDHMERPKHWFHTRTRPDISKAEKYKTEMCRDFTERKFCHFGTNCKFAHKESDLRMIQRHPNYKKAECRDYFAPDGFCKFGHRCSLSHVRLSNQDEEEFTPDEKIQQNIPHLHQLTRKATMNRMNTSVDSGTSLQSPISDHEHLAAFHGQRTSTLTPLRPTQIPTGCIIPNMTTLSSPGVINPYIFRNFNRDADYPCSKV